MMELNSTSIASLHDIESMGNIPRYEKGFYFEMNIQTLLDEHNVNYEGNPIFYDEWKRTTRTGYDIKITGLNFKVECKYLSKPIYESWFKRDWLSRDADIYVTTDPYFVPHQCRKQLANMGKKLFTPWQFIWYILKLSYGNKCNLNMSLLVSCKTVNRLKLDVNARAECVETGLKDIPTKFRQASNQLLHRSQSVAIILLIFSTLKTVKSTSTMTKTHRLQKPRFPLLKVTKAFKSHMLHGVEIPLLFSSLVFVGEDPYHTLIGYSSTRHYGT